MSDQPAAATALPPPSESWLDEPKRSEGWTRKKFYLLLALAIALHVALIFVFGTKKPILPRPVGDVPHLQLAGRENEIIALNDPTLFARPNAHDLVTAFWRQTPPVTQPNFNWQEDPRYLPPAPGNFGAAFREFMQAGQPAGLPLNFKPEPELTAPVVTSDDALPQATTMQITGDLARRRLLTSVTNLPSLSLNDVIAPSRLQVLVDTAGNVASAVLLPSDNDLEAAGRSEIGDSHALAIVRSLRFAPAPRLTFGGIIFHWHTVPLTSTNAP